METEKSILGLSKSLFWDVDPQVIDPRKHAAYIVERVVSRGTWDEFKIILTYYGKNKVAAVVTQLRFIEKTTFSFCSTYFDIPKQKFRCFTYQQLSPQHWDY